ncbi:ABC transporter permease [Natronospirillum operosum]|uniref:ABC transporter permease n=1 Tax=Natronospirillum operosum TaxID=2759953 RepID=A0A4Z0WBK7_9GAMM|nr:ABC transporter permease [Natronospirillum operosum]TGG95184.1 ABC transporter permease [Natronospirillum operosum]
MTQKLLAKTEPDPSVVPTQNANVEGLYDEERAPKLTWKIYLRALFSDRVTLIAALFLIIMAVSALGAQFLAPFDPNQIDIMNRFMPPLSMTDAGQFHLLGTDQLGRDVLSRLMHGAQVSISIGFLGAICSGLLGITLGIIAGYKRGLFEDIVMRLVDGMQSLPSLLIALFVLFIIGGGYFNLVLVFTFLQWTVFCRMARSLTLNLRDSNFISAARVLGCTDARIMLRHILPNMVAPLMVLFTLEVAILILSEASLSFLGFGVQPPNASWGRMIASGRDHINTAWWLVTLPGLAIFLTALALNLLAGWCRAVSDPVHSSRWLTPKRKQNKQEG